MAGVMNNVVPLSVGALAVLTGLPKIDAGQKPGDPDYWFTNDGKRALCGFRPMKKKFDKRVLAELCREHGPDVELQQWQLLD